MLALLPPIMIENAFCNCLQSFLRISSPKRFRQSQLTPRPMARAQDGLNDTNSQGVLLLCVNL